MQQQVYSLQDIQLVKLAGSRDSRLAIPCAEYSILAIVGGYGGLWIDNESFELDKRGRIVFANPGATVYFADRSETVQGLTMYRLTFGIYDAMTGKPSSSQTLFANGEVGGASSYLIRDLAETMERFSRDPSSSGRFKLQMLFHEMLHLMAKEVEASRGAPPAGSAIEQVLAYIDEHYAANLQRDQMAAMAGVNPEYFSRLFRKETGQSFSKYMAATRIRKAQELLLVSRSSLRDIARRVGFNNEFYLSRKFKEVTGGSPSFYQRKRKRIASVSSHFTACLLALGVTPVLAKINPFIEARYESQLQETATHRMDLHTFHYNRLVEETAPDLILCPDTYSDLHLLKRMAPTIALPLAKLSAHEQFLFIAGIVGETEQAKRHLARLDEKVERAKAQLAGAMGPEETVLIMEIWQDKLLVFGSQMGRAGQLLYGLLGLRPPELVRQELTGDRWYRILPLQDLPRFAADRIFLTVYEEKGGGPYAAEVMGSREWASLPAVRRSRVYVNDHGTFYNWDPLSMEAQLELIVRQLMS